MLKKIQLAGALAVVIAFVPVTQFSAQSKAKKNPHTESAAQLSDQFIPHVLEMNAAEAEFARVAQNKAQNQRVKDFAEMIVTAHTQTIENLGGLYAAGYDTTKMTKSGHKMDNYESRQKPTESRFSNDVYWHLDKEHQRTLDRLNSLTGAAFDREFVNVMVRGHQNGISFYETHLAAFNERSADNVQKAFALLARASLPTLKDHLKQAQALQRNRTTN